LTKLEFDYEREYQKYIDDHNLWDEENEKLKKNVYHVLGTRNQKLDEKTGGYYGGEQYIKGFTTKPHKQDTCQYCFGKLTGRHRKFCSPRCGDLYGKIKNECIELKGEIIFWERDMEVLPEWKNMNVTYRGKNGELFTDYDDGITTKSGKFRKNKSIESNEFSKGIDY